MCAIRRIKPPRVARLRGSLSRHRAAMASRPSPAPAHAPPRARGVGLGVGRAAPRAAPRAATASGTLSAVPTLDEARRAASPLSTALDPADPAALPERPAVFALLDGDAPDARVAYVGVSKRLRSAVADAAEVLRRCAPESESASISAESSASAESSSSSSVFVAVGPLPKTARKPAMREALAAWTREIGDVPRGNALEMAEATKSGEANPTAASAAPPASSSAMASVARAIVTPEVISRLARDGFVVVDDAAPEETLRAARHSADRLLADGKMRHVGQEGRDDFVAVLDANRLPSVDSEYGGLASAAELLVALAEAVREEASSGGADGKGEEGGAEKTHQSLQQRSAWTVVTDAPAAGVGEEIMSREKKNTDAGSSGGPLSRETLTLGRLRSLTAPSRLMLAHYPGGSSARYVTHLDNDPSDPGHREGAPGTRACDRAVTAILYLNPGWEEKHGGCLRIELEDGRGEADVAPSWGRLVMFDCRRMPHEVRPTSEGRWAMTAWINDEDAEGEGEESPE